MGVVFGVFVDVEDAPAGGGTRADPDQDVGVLMVAPHLDRGQWVAFDGFPVGFVVAAGWVGIDPVPAIGEEIGESLTYLRVG